MQENLCVTKEESKQKLFNFLQRRLDTNTSELHKWIRSGQVRINGKRSQAFDRLEENDQIRIPPFAQLKQELLQVTNSIPQKRNSEKSPTPLIKIYEDTDLLVINKPCGLAVQGGSKQEFSISQKLKYTYKHVPFSPTPAHRLDKDTSGLLLIAKSYTMLQELHLAFSSKENSELKKIYLAQVANVPKEGLWEDFLHIQKDINGREKTYITHKLQEGKKALSFVKLLATNNKNSLLEVELITGRKHQIRVQSAHRNSPIIGDRKYGTIASKRLCLHAYKIIWKGQEFCAEPEWNVFYK